MLLQNVKAVGVSFALAAVLIMSSPAALACKPGAGNNGTLKVHEIGTPVGTENNDPKVCAFNLEGFGFDAGQKGYLKFNVQGGDGPHGAAPEAIYSFGPTNSKGYAISRDFNNGANTVVIPNGHYKVTLYGKMLPKGQLTDVKAKSKVFKVSCQAEVKHEDKKDCDHTKTPTTTKPDEGGSGGGVVLGDNTPTPSVTPTPTVTATTSPTVLENTGAHTAIVSALSVLLAAAAIFVARKPLADSIEESQTRINAIAL